MRFSMCMILILFFSTFVFGQPYGLDERVSNTSLLIISSGNVPNQLKLTRVFSNASLTYPVFLTSALDSTNRIFIVEKGGRILEMPNEYNTQDISTFLDITSKVRTTSECGLLGLAFHPDYKDNGLFYVYYIDAALNSVLAEFKTSSSDPNKADLNSERILLKFSQPAGNHNGGMLTFGPDGYLYLGLGDGGGGGDTYHNGQNMKTLFASIIRIDVDNKDDNLQYAIPEDNPFYGYTDSTRQEIWAYGLRNPWRFSFDWKSGILWCGDVGQARWEEVDIIEKGNNYGWNIMEGFHCFEPSSGCDQEGLTLPIIEYSHSIGNSITGGYVYRGNNIPGLQGWYIYGDYVTRLIWALNYSNGEVVENKQMTESPNTLSSFGEDEAGELYALGYDNGAVYLVENGDSSQVSNVPQTISESALYSDINTKTFSPGIIPYDVNVPFWSDGAIKKRAIALPGTTQITFSKDGHWQFPNESVLVKNFYLEMEARNPQSKRIIETRFLVKRSSGDQWDGYSYIWNDEQTDATLLSSDTTKSFTITDPSVEGGTYQHEHYYPSHNQCNSCHTPAAGFVLGLKTSQINRDFDYDNGVTDNQLRSYNHIGLFDQDIGEDYTDFPKLPDTRDTTYSLENRARAYLASNCSQCHLPQGTGRSDIDLRYEIPLESAHIIDVDPEIGNLGIDGAKRIKSGAPDSSVIYLRMIDPGEYRMPPLASIYIDTAGAALISAWIKSLAPVTSFSQKNNIPDNFYLVSYPNPFNPQTTVGFSIPQKSLVTLTVYDILGKQIRILLNKTLEKGAHSIIWNAKNNQGNTVTSGIFFCELKVVPAITSDESRSIKKLIYLK